MTERLPDIVLVVFDTARWDRFGCYGYGGKTTPTVDALAQEGLRFETMIANGPWTMPSHGSLFTGLFPAQHGLHWQTKGGLRATTTLARWLGRLGYVTICATANGLISAETGLADGFSHHVVRGTKQQKPSRARRVRTVLWGPTAPGRALNDWIRGELHRVRGPLFLFVNYLHCHWPYVPPRGLDRAVGGAHLRWSRVARYRATVARTMGPWEAIARADAKQLEMYSALYDAELATADERLAELLGILEHAGRLRDGECLVMVTSDHGEHIGEHGLADHQASLDPHLTRIPFVVYAPHRVPSGVRRSIHELVDVFPSVVRFLGEEPPVPDFAARRHGMFVGDDDDDPAQGYAFSEWRGWTADDLRRLRRKNPSYDFDALPGSLVSVRDLHHQLVRDDHATEVLYAVSDQVEELDIGTVDPDVVRGLRSRLDAAVTEWAASDAIPTDISQLQQAEIERRLEDLGYI